MAEELKRNFDIVVLKVELLDVPIAGDDFRCTLQYKVRGELTNASAWTASTSAIGLGSRRANSTWLGRGPSIQLPSEMLNGLRDWLVKETRGDRPLWVHLVRPYGSLRLVPWERLLGEALDVPILMLPDFIFPPPRETKAALEVVLCGSAPLGFEQAFVREAIQLSVERILEGPVRRTRIHVFTDHDIAQQLRDTWAGWPLIGTNVLIQDHAIAARHVNDDTSTRPLERSGLLRSPWLLWMRDALRNRAVDVVHFACHGYMARDRGAMIFAQSPLERTERYLAGPVGGSELHTFLTQVGAWSTVFTSPFGNHSEPGLRALADELAQSRPGPLIMASMSVDPKLETLGQAYRFVYSAEPNDPPKSNALFIYCQPYLTADAQRRRGQLKSARSVEAPAAEIARNMLQQRVADSADEESPLDDLFLGNENVEPWIAATQRFAEQVQLRYQQFARDELAPEAQCQHDTKVALKTVDDLRRAVARAATKRSGSGEGGAL